MHLASQLLAALITMCCLASAPRTQGAWLTDFDQPGFGISGRVYGLGTYRNELIACTYRKPWRDGSQLAHIGRFDGRRWYPLGSGLSAPPRTAVEFQGDLFVGGEFTVAGGVAANRIARWNGTQWTTVGAGFDDTVWALCEHQGSLYATGSFTQSGGQLVNGIARWNGSQWLPLGSGLTSLPGDEPAGRALVSDGTNLWVGGRFDRAGGITVNHVARWNGTSWSSVGGGVAGTPLVKALAWHQGQLFVGGFFVQAGSVAADSIASWNGSQWAQVGQGVQGTIYTPEVDSLCVWNGDLYVGGTFDRTGGIGGVELNRIARYDGVALQPIGGVGAAEFNPPSVIAMTTWNSRLYCGGEFQLAGTPGVAGLTQGVYHIASYDGSDWAAVGDGLGFSNEVRALTRYQGDVVAGGRFVIAGDQWANTLARFDGTAWRHFGTFDGLVWGALEHQGQLWVVGEFGTVDGQQADGVARFDGTSWDALGGSVLPNHHVYSVGVYQGSVYVGTVGALKRWTGLGWQDKTLSGTVMALHEYQGQLVVGCAALGATFGAPNLLSWNGSTLSSIDPGLNGSVASLGTFGGDLIVGGYFTQAGSLAARSIVRWNGSSWSPLGNGTGTSQPPGNLAVHAIADVGGLLTIGGGFTRQGGAAADHIMQWTGASWIPFAAAEPNGTVAALLHDPVRAELHIGGNFFKVGTGEAWHYSIHQTTPSWTTVGNPLPSPRRAPRLVGDGRMLPGTQLRWRLSSALENTWSVFVFGHSQLGLPIFGGLLEPSPDALVAMPTDGIGTADLILPWVPLPTGLPLWTQTAIVDPTGPQGWTLSNAVRMVTP